MKTNNLFTTVKSCHLCNGLYIKLLFSSPRTAYSSADLHEEDLDERGAGPRQASRRQVPLPPGNTGQRNSAYNTIYYSCLYGSSILIKRVPYKRTLLYNLFNKICLLLFCHTDI